MFHWSLVEDIVSDRRALAELKGPLGDGIRMSHQWSGEKGLQSRCFRLYSHNSPEGDDLAFFVVGNAAGVSFPVPFFIYIGVGAEFEEWGWGLNLKPS